MAEVLPDGSEILTIENNRDHARIAQGFFDRSPNGSKIILSMGNALEILKTLPAEKTELVFIDADKQNYSAYYGESMRIVRPGGLILADNALWYSRVFDPKDDDSRAMADFNDLVKMDNRAEKLFLGRHLCDTETHCSELDLSSYRNALLITPADTMQCLGK